jgi:hypothetical protein
MKWQTKDGGVTNTTQMTEAHLVNSYRYCMNRKDYKSASVCKNELNARKRYEYHKREKDCPFCDGKMRPVEYVYDPIEVGFSLPEYTYCFQCRKCGASSGEIEPPEEFNLSNTGDI